MRIKTIALSAALAFLGINVSAQDKVEVRTVSSKEPEDKIASIAGIVKDSRSKKPLNEAVITVSSAAFEGRKIALTDSTGMYRIQKLPAGVYTVTFEMEGFKTFTQENIVLKPGMSMGVSFEMARDRDRQKKEKVVVKAEN